MARLLQNGDATSSWRSTHPYNSRKCGLKTHPKKIMGKNHPNSSTINSIYRWSLMIFPWVLQNWLGAIFRGNSCQKFQQSTRWTGEPKDCHVWLRIHIPNPNGWLNRLYIYIYKGINCGSKIHWSICLLPQKLIVTGWWDISASWKGSLFVTIFTGICCLSTSYPFRVFKCNLVRLRVFNGTGCWIQVIFLFSPRNLGKIFTHFDLRRFFQGVGSTTN